MLTDKKKRCFQELPLCSCRGGVRSKEGGPGPLVIPVDEGGNVYLLS